MDDLVSENEFENPVVDIVVHVATEQVGRSKPFLDILSKKLRVQGFYKVGMHMLII